MNRRLALAPALTLAATGVLALAGPASAHVTVNPATASGGSYSKLTFRVPTESDTASTTKLAVYFPSSPGFASVSVKPHPGWRFTVSKHGDDVSKIVWTPVSPASAIKPGEFDEFDVSLGPLPDSGSVVFKALQTYSDGSVVRWIQPTVAGQPEPDHPAPVLTLTPTAPGGTATAGAGNAVGDSAEATPAQPIIERQESSKAPLVLSIVAVVLAALAGLLSLVGRRRS
jgi:uncharacterized protein YcnI